MNENNPSNLGDGEGWLLAFVLAILVFWRCFVFQGREGFILLGAGINFLLEILENITGI